MGSFVLILMVSGVVTFAPLAGETIAMSLEALPVAGALATLPSVEPPPPHAAAARPVAAMTVRSRIMDIPPVFYAITCPLHAEIGARVQTQARLLANARKSRAT